MVEPAGTFPATSKAITPRRIFPASVFPAKKWAPAPLLKLPVALSYSVLSWLVTRVTVAASAGLASISPTSATPETSGFQGVAGRMPIRSHSGHLGTDASTSSAPARVRQARGSNRRVLEEKKVSPKGCVDVSGGIAGRNGFPSLDLT